jgi:hypothetical protein
MGSSFQRVALLALLMAACFPAAGAAESDANGNNGGWLAMEFPRDSPVLVVSFNMGPTTAHPRGISMALDLHASVVLRNVSSKPISGVTLRVEAQDLTPLGKGSVTMPSLYVLPGEEFPVRINMDLLRPFNVPKSDNALVQVALDCALFNDLTAYGPDKLHSRRSLMVFEMQARRDRRYLAKLLQDGQTAQVREELDFGMNDIDPQQLGLELLQGPRTESRREQPVTVSPVSFASSPVQAMRGAAQVSGNEVRIPQVEVRNISRKAVRSIEMGWIVRDERGKDFMAGSLPATMGPPTTTALGPVQTASLNEPGTLRFSRPTGQPMTIGALMTFVSDVEFTDGKLWIPSRDDIYRATSDPILRHELAASPEQQRLVDVYRRKGMAGIVEELKRQN